MHHNETRNSDEKGASLNDRIEQPSLVTLARDAIRRSILSGDLKPGERLVEERLVERLGVSRPPLREALRLLENDGIVETRPRRGAVVATMDEHDVYEVMTLRMGLEKLAVELGVPVRDQSLLQAVKDALARMKQDVENEDRAALVQDAYLLHSSIVDLAGHRRLSMIYRSVQQQILLCMSRNLIAREGHHEDLDGLIERHVRLIKLIEAGDPQAVLEEMAVHGEWSFS
jgi:DNA-binding GntR family transcriptional regulator